MSDSFRPADDAPASYYRVFIVNTAGHAVAPAIILEARSDDQALEQAQAYVDGHGVEVWSGNRMVGALPPESD